MSLLIREFVIKFEPKISVFHSFRILVITVLKIKHYYLNVATGHAM